MVFLFSDFVVLLFSGYNKENEMLKDMFEETEQDVEEGDFLKFIH